MCHNKQHSLFSCYKFQGLTVQEKSNTVRFHKHCSNCLRNNHTEDICKSFFACKVCQQKHHTLLHIYETPQQGTNASFQIAHTHLTQIGYPSTSNNFHTRSENHNVKIIGTAKVKVTNERNGVSSTVRVLIDPGSEISYIVDSLVNDLQLERSKFSTKVTAFGGIIAGEIDFLVNFKLQSIHDHFEVPVTAAVANLITGDLPTNSVPLEEFHIPNGLSLADPEFNIPGPIHILLGVGPTARVKERGIFRISSGMIAQRTRLGYVVEGEMGDAQSDMSSIFMTQTMAKRLNEQIERFWRLEELTEPSPRNSDDILCEEIFTNSSL